MMRPCRFPAAKPGRWRPTVVAAAIAVAVGAAPAAAQDYVIQQPGAAPVYVHPLPGSDGYAIQRPGRSPVYVNPRSGGGSVVQSPGETPAYVNPPESGGATVPPDRLPAATGR